jgi:hypothetical protein
MADHGGGWLGFRDLKEGNCENGRGDGNWLGVTKTCLRLGICSFMDG